MSAIFYDLETSDKNFIGQILNYCFVLVDDDLQVRDELSGEIFISRLQLPDPSAILANRIDVLKHQERTAEAEFHECNAVRRIAQFIELSLHEEKQKMPLVGFNSSRFDLPYLRTSLIRNGINPYFGGKLLYRDVFTAVKKLYVSHPSFPWQEFKITSADGEERLSLKLETVAQHFKLLDGRQTHHARDDVYLTIELARLLRARFALDVLRFDAYEPTGRLSRGALATQLVPNYETPHERAACIIPMALLDDDYRYALWVDLERYRAGEGRSSIQWFNKSVSSFIIGPLPDESYERLSSQACQDFQNVRLLNYFEQSRCDIEQDIYRLDMQHIQLLGEAIWSGNPAALNGTKGKDLWRLYIRHCLREYSWQDPSFLTHPEQDLSPRDRATFDLFRKYCCYRYGGSLRLDKGAHEHGQFHPSLEQLLSSLESLICTASPQEHALLIALKSFYLSSQAFQASTHPDCARQANQAAKEMNRSGSV